MKRSELYEAPLLDMVECMVESGIAFSQDQEIIIEDLLYEDYQPE